MGCQPKCDVTYIRTVVVVVGIEYYYVDAHLSGTIKQILQHGTRKHNILEVKIVGTCALTATRGLLSYKNGIFIRFVIKKLKFLENSVISKFLL